MAAHAFTLFDTALGTCGIAWSAAGLTSVQLPEADAGETRARLARRAAEATEVPPHAQAAIDGIVALLRGEPDDLADVGLDLDGVPEFHARVYALARAIPPGGTLTYGELARRAGSPGSAQAVGQAMARNPVPIVVPCHRVLAASGDGGFSGAGGVLTKRRMLAIEGALTLFDADTVARLA